MMEYLVSLIKKLIFEINLFLANINYSYILGIEKYLFIIKTSLIV